MSSLQNINECPDCYSILTQCIIENIHIKDLIMLCNKSDCDCYSNTNNPHYAMIPTCNIYVNLYIIILDYKNILIILFIVLINIVIKHILKMIHQL